MPRPFDLASFERFHDQPESPFYVAEGLTPEETWVRITEGQERALSSAVDLALARRPVTPEWLAATHTLIFEHTFPRDAGRFRGFLAGGTPEDVWFGVTDGTASTARVRQMKGAHPNRIVERLDRACIEFEQAAFELGQEVATVKKAAFACVRLYAKIAGTQPFIDGNLRVAWTALQATLLSLDLPVVEFADLEAHDAALDSALRVDADQSYAPLADLVDTIVKSAA